MCPFREKAPAIHKILPLHGVRGGDGISILTCDGVIHEKDRCLLVDLVRRRSVIRLAIVADILDDYG